MPGAKPTIDQTRRPGDPPHVRKFHARDDAGRVCCGARKAKGGSCRVWKPGDLYPNGRCRRHGGRAPGHPLTAGGQYSATIDRLRAACAELQAEESVLLNPLPVIAKLSGICQRLEERAAEGDSPEFRRQSLALLEQAAQGDVGALRSLGELLRRGVREDQHIEALALNLERLAKRIEAAVRIKLDASRLMTEREMQKALTVWLGLLLDRYADDPAALRVIAAMTDSLERSFGSVVAERQVAAALAEREG